MTWIPERSFCEWYTRRAYRDDGAIVELGVWLGSLTRALAKGLAGRGSSAAIQAYDLFQWDQSMNDHAYDDETRAMRPGDNFRAIYERSLGEFSANVDVHEADLSQEPWAGGPISLLVVDAMKSWALTDAIAANFFPSVNSGSLIAHQDFSHAHCPMIPLISYRQRDHLRVFADLAGSDTVVFEVLKPFDPSVMDLAHPASYDPSEVDAAYAYWKEQLQADKHAKLGMSKASFYLDCGDFARATRALTEQLTSVLPPDPIDVQLFHDFLAIRQNQRIVYEGSRRVELS